MTQALSGTRMIDAIEPIDFSIGSSISVGDPELLSGIVPIRIMSLTYTDQ